jgi:hypothetical protein
VCVQDADVKEARKAFFQTLYRDSTLDRWNAAIVGCRVKVYWPIQKSWFPGYITKYRASKGRHKCVSSVSVHVDVDMFAYVSVEANGLCPSGLRAGVLSPVVCWCRIVYDDQGMEWLSIMDQRDRVVVDNGILSVTDAMKTHLGIPLDGVMSAITDTSTLKYRPVTPEKKKKIEIAKPWVPPWEKEEEVQRQKVRVLRRCHCRLGCRCRYRLPARRSHTYPSSSVRRVTNVSAACMCVCVCVCRRWRSGCGGRRRRSVRWSWRPLSTRPSAGAGSRCHS